MLRGEVFLDQVGNVLGASSLSVSLTRTALRTRNCRLPPGESTQRRLLLVTLSSRHASTGDRTWTLSILAVLGWMFTSKRSWPVRRQGRTGPAQQQTRTFGTMTAQLLALADWLAEQ